MILKKQYFIFLSITLLLGAAVLLYPRATRQQPTGSPKPDSNGKPARPVSQARVSQASAKLPLSFELNVGQTDRRAKFLSRGRDYDLFLTPTEAVLALKGHKSEKSNSKLDPPEDPPRRTVAGRTRRGENSKLETILRMKLLGANPHSEIVGLDKLSGRVSHFVGNDPNKWRTNIPTYAKVKHENVYPGVDLVYYGNQKQLEYDFILAPGADPKAITLAFGLAQGRSHGSPLRIDEGDLVLQTDGGAVRLHRPHIYQDINGTRQSISGGYRLHKIETPKSKIQSRESKIQNPKSKIETVVTFEVGAYDTSKPLVIDPVLIYATYLGGSNDDDGRSMTVDGSGNVYVLGESVSMDFPTTGEAVRTSCCGVFVTKFNAEGSDLVYSTFLGGEGSNHGNGIDVDASGCAYVTGYTNSTNFPTTPDAFQNTHNGGWDAFVTKFNPDGSALVYSTYLGGRGSDTGWGVAVDAQGYAYVTGATNSINFPTTAGAFQTVYNGGFEDVFVTKLNTNGSALIYSTYVGGRGWDVGWAIDVDPSGNAHITGWTESRNFPTTPTAVQTTHGGGTWDAFVTKLNAEGSALVYSTFLGGRNSESGWSIAVDGDGNAYVVGDTYSRNFPTTSGAFQTAHSGHSDVFVTKLSPDGSVLRYSTFLGGRGWEVGEGVDVDAWGNAYVTGITSSKDFPTTSNAFQPDYGGGSNDAFVTKLSPDGSALLYSTFLGGSDYDAGRGIAIDDQGCAYVAGNTRSTDFPVRPGAFQTEYNGGLYDAFVVKISP